MLPGWVKPDATFARSGDAAVGRRDVRDGRLMRVALGSNCDPLAAARWLRDEPRAVAMSGAWCGGGTVLSSFPLVVADATEDPFALLDETPVGVTREASLAGGGWIGWLGFGLASRIEALPPAPPGAEGQPAFDLAFHDHIVRCDDHGRWWFEAMWSEARSAFLAERLELWRGRLAGEPPPARRWRAGVLRPVGAGLAGHRVAVADAIERIAAGEMSQANICLALETDFDGDPLDLWITAVEGSGSPYSAFISSDIADRAVVSLSPELFLRRRGREVLTRPIKGTAAIADDPAALVSSAKDRAENVMIVDLMRNDLGRVCSYGSVRVDELCGVRRAPGVWHLESTVSGQLRPGVSDAELLRATFPPGSVTGAPKVQAMRAIHTLESTARHAYCGAIGWCHPSAGLELSVAIRTLEVSCDRVWLGVGGGIVADSSPSAEIEELLHKARGVASAAGLSIEASPPTGVPNRRISRLPRPDPEHGVFETLNVLSGRPVAIADHLARLRNSCAQLGLTIEQELEVRLAETAARIRDGAIRVDVSAAGTSVKARNRPQNAPVQLAPVVVPVQLAPVVVPVQLAPVVVPGGLGSHKWSDRRLIDAHSGPGRTPLICDTDGAVLEAGYAAVIAIDRERLITPPLDGRLLPSISRKRVLDAAARIGWTIAHEPIGIDQVIASNALILTSSLRGPHLGILAGSRTAPDTLDLCTRLHNAWEAALAEQVS